MSKNVLYTNEITTAHQFILAHDTDADLQCFLHDMREKNYLMHSDRWSMCYDFLQEHYPEATGAIVTGLTYWLESQEAVMQKVYFIGDIHGNMKPIKNFINRCSDELTQNVMNGDENVLICLGDFGANFFLNYRDVNFKKFLSKCPLTFFVIRGNHEERPTLCAATAPNEWTNEMYFNNFVWVEKAYPNIKYAMDFPAIYVINGHSTLVIPGAYSVDKYYRLQMGWSWFPQEQLTQDEMDDGIILCTEADWKIDLVLSHTCPICYEPTDLFIQGLDQSIVEKDMERYLGKIEFNLNYKVWLWGHYHAFRDYPRTEDRIKIMLSAGEECLRLEQVMNGEIEKI